MKATVEFTIYGATTKAIEAQAIVALQALGGSDQMWDVRYNLSIGIARFDGTTNTWKADVYAVTRNADNQATWEQGS